MCPVAVSVICSLTLQGVKEIAMSLRRAIAETVIDYGDFGSWTGCILHYDTATAYGDPGVVWASSFPVLKLSL